MSLAGQMHTNLVRAAGFDGDFEQRERRVGRERIGGDLGFHLDQRDRTHAIGVVVGDDLDAPFAVGQQVFVQRLVNHALLGRPVAADQCQVNLVGFALAELFLQQFQRHASLGDQQDAAGFTIQPMHQFKKISFGPGHAQLLNDAKAHAAAAMHRNASGLVDGEQKIVLKQNRKFCGGCIAADRRAGAMPSDFLRHDLGFLLGPL